MSMLFVNASAHAACIWCKPWRLLRMMCFPNPHRAALPSAACPGPHASGPTPPLGHASGWCKTGAMDALGLAAAQSTPDVFGRTSRCVCNVGHMHARLSTCVHVSVVVLHVRHMHARLSKCVHVSVVVLHRTTALALHFGIQTETTILGAFGSFASPASRSTSLEAGLATDACCMGGCTYI